MLTITNSSFKRRLTSICFLADISHRHRRYYKRTLLTFFSPPPGLCCAFSIDPTFEVTVQSSFFDSIYSMHHSPILKCTIRHSAFAKRKDIIIIRHVKQYTYCTSANYSVEELNQRAIL